MTTLLLTLFISMLLPYLAKAPLVVAMHKQPGGYDNHNPREQQARLQGFGVRANAAHYNSFEALLIYACAVVAVAISGTVDQITQALAWLFVVSRIGYLLCYWYDLASVRSLIWMVGMMSAFIMIGRSIWFV